MTNLQRAIDATTCAIPTMSARQLHEALVTAQETVDALVRRVAELGIELAEVKASREAWRQVAETRTLQEQHWRHEAQKVTESKSTPLQSLADALLWREARASVALDKDPRWQTMCAQDFEEGEDE